MNPEIEDFVGVFPNALSDQWCDSVIKLFEIRTALHGMGGTFGRNTPNVSDVALSIGTETNVDCYDKHRQDLSARLSWGNAHSLMTEFDNAFWQNAYPEYVLRYPVLKILGAHRVGSIKVQKTLPHQGYHVFHCENDSNEHGNRLLFIIVYLNDVHDGGETEFLFQGKRVPPRKGTLLLAPAGFTHTHRGNPPLKQEKYILTTWVEFSD